MKCAVIDIGSNSMRLSAYDADADSFRVLFREKVMAGLAGYVDNGRLNYEGIACACAGLQKFRGLLDLLQIDRVSVFATASLRNVANTEQAVREIEAATGFAVEVISGEEEALLGYRGAMRELSMTEGVFVDIGGASTEVAAFRDGQLLRARSYPVGSLKLYRECVRKILPGRGGLERIARRLREELPADVPAPAPGGRLACVGGTARAALRFARKVYGLPESCHAFSALQLETLCDALCRCDRAAIDLLLKTEPERIHTAIPGMLILRCLVRRFDAAELVVSQYGVREGYLCQRILTSLS